MREKPQQLVETDEEEWKRVRAFISSVDKPYFENQFVIWTANMLNGDSNQEGL